MCKLCLYSRSCSSPVLCINVTSRSAFTQLGNQEMIYWLIQCKVTFLWAHNRLRCLQTYRLPLEFEKLPQVPALCRSGYSEFPHAVICVLGGVRGGGAKFIFGILYTNDAIENDVRIGKFGRLEKKRDSNRFFPESNQWSVFLVETEFLVYEAGIECL